MLGVRVLSGSTVTQRYFHTDNLGSISVITDASGNVVERDGYDAWGKRRFPNGADDPTGSLTSQVTRGFTGQEELADVGLVHLNGRVYDPLVARMMAADPMVDTPLNGQTWNRYSYVGNNPLTFTDPSGYCFLGCGTWQNLGKMQPGTLFRQNPMLGSIVEIAATGACGMLMQFGCVPQVVAVLASTMVAGITSGRLGKDVLRAGIVTTATIAAFAVVGSVTSQMPGAIAGDDGTDGTFKPWSEGHIANMIGHALVGCGQSVASGGKCGPGALVGVVTSAAGPYIYNLNYGLAVAANAALGGGAAVLGGGKFQNGAITGAFGYMFNSEGEGRAIGALIGRAIPGLGFVLDLIFAPPAGNNSSLDTLLDKLNWGNLNTLQDHYNRHGSDFDATDPIDYAIKARDWFVENDGRFQQRLTQGTELSECMIQTQTLLARIILTGPRRHSITRIPPSTDIQQTGTIG
jgi:RHS repeat-associated protein